MLATVMNALQLQAALESVGVPVRVQTVRFPFARFDFATLRTEQRGANTPAPPLRRRLT